MVTAVHYLAIEADHFALLDYLGEPDEVSLRPWPIATSPPVALSRSQALSTGSVAVVSAALGEPVIMQSDSQGMSDPGVSGVFNRLNWDRLKPTDGEGLIDSNRSPVLHWTPGQVDSSSIQVSSIGSQADAIKTVSDEYARWVNRCMNYVRRKGTKVWGLETSQIRPDLDIRIPTVSTVFALPGALAALESGANAR